MSDIEGIIRVVESFFRVGTTKDLSRLKGIQLEGSEYSSFSDVPPYGLKDFATSIALQELRFVSISDYEYEIRSPKISVFGDTAVVAFELQQRGMLVDNKAFTGEHIVIDGRATFVLVRRPDWRIAHMHLSSVPGRRS